MSESYGRGLLAAIIVGIILIGILAFLIGYGYGASKNPIVAGHTYTSTTTTTWWTWSVTTFTKTSFYPVCFLKTEAGWYRVTCPPDIPSFP